MRSTRTVITLALLIGACGDDGKTPIGGACEDGVECASGFCFARACIDPEGDADDDGLLNRVEADLGTDLFVSDSDGDGVADPDELDPGFVARDSDDDGIIDALESAASDADHDCLVDEHDRDDDTPNRADARLTALIDEHCPDAIGVCAAGLAVRCDPEPSCELDLVSGYEAVEQACDQRDNDCDGATDEGCVPIEPLQIGLVAHWPLDGDGDDRGPFGDDATIEDVTVVADRHGHANGAIRFDAEADRVVAEATHHPLADATFTYALWVRPEPTRAAQAPLLGVGRSPLETQSRVSLSGARRCLAYGSEAILLQASRGCVPAGHWTFVALVRTPGGTRIYMNGREVAQDGPATLGLDGSRLELGGAGFRGALDDVRIWERALTQSELMALYHADAWPDVGTAANPAAHCAHVRDGGAADATDGRYVIAAGGAPLEVTCDLTREGGGWTLVWRYGFTAPATFADAANAVTPIPSWPARAGDVSLTAPTSTSRGAIDFALWHALGTDMLFESDLLDTIACTAFRGSLADGLSGEVLCLPVADVVARCTDVVPQFLAWDDDGPYLTTSAQSSTRYLSFEGASDAASPIHDPCAASQSASAAASSGGAVWLRPSSVEPDYPDSCDDVRSEDVWHPSHRIDPDGQGGAPSFLATCDHRLERGGWARLTPDVGASIAGAREYLIADDDRWYRSPVTTVPWRWDSFIEQPGLWIFAGPDGAGSFVCGGAVDAAGWGVGCGPSAPSDEPRVRPGGAADPETGTSDVCQSPPDAFDEACTSATVWVRPRACYAAGMLGDGELDGLLDGSSPCWQSYGGVFEAAESSPSASPALAITGKDAGIVQRGLTFVADRRYVVAFWARAATPRWIGLHVAEVSEPLHLDATWRFYERSFVAEATTFDGVLELYAAGPAGPTVWLDGVGVDDLGPSPCRPPAGELVADGGFDAGRTCWYFLHDANITVATATLDLGQAPSTPPSLVIRHDPGVAQPTLVTLRQDVTLAPARSYRLSFAARADAPRSIVVTVRDATGVTSWLLVDVPVETAWQTETYDFVSTAGGAATLELQVGSTEADAVWLDDVALVDLGPAP